MVRNCTIYKLSGLIKYEQAWKYQRVLAEHIHQTKKAGSAVGDQVLVLQHPRIFTLGRGATRDNLKFNVDDHSIEDVPNVLRVERGGEVTWHGPGQLVVYPILDLNNHKKDLHWYTTQLEESVINMLKNPPYNIPRIGRHDINTGVWITKQQHLQQQQQHSKISAIGVTASRWITMHGLSLNLHVDFRDYQYIIPCGIEETGTVKSKAKAEIEGKSEGESSQSTFGVTSLHEHVEVEVEVDKNEVETSKFVQDAVDNYITSFSETFYNQADNLNIIQGEQCISELEHLVQIYPEVSSKVLPKDI